MELGPEAAPIELISLDGDSETIFLAYPFRCPPLAAAGRNVRLSDECPLGMITPVAIHMRSGMHRECPRSVAACSRFHFGDFSPYALPPCLFGLRWEYL